MASGRQSRQVRADLSTNGHPATSLPALIDLYLLRCEVEGMSPNTITAFGWTLRHFYQGLVEERVSDEVASIT